MVSMVTQPRPRETGSPGWWLRWLWGCKQPVPCNQEPLSLPRPGCRVESIYLNVESVNTHRERSEVSGSFVPLALQHLHPVLHPEDRRVAGPMRVNSWEAPRMVLPVNADVCLPVGSP